MEIELLKKGTFRIVLKLNYDKQLVPLLLKTSWGTRGMRYTQMNVSERLENLDRSYFLHIFHGNKLIGNVTFCYRETTYKGEKINAYYIRYFMFVEHWMASKDIEFGKKMRKSFLKAFIESFLSEPPYMHGIGFNEDTSLKTVYYAYIDDLNIRSLNASLGFDLSEVSKFNTFLFSRFSPKKKLEVNKVSTGELAINRMLLRDEFNQYEMFFNNGTLGSNNCFSVKNDDGETLVSAQVSFCTWKITQVEGMLSRFALDIAQYVSAIRKYFNPEQLEFLAVNNIYVRKGCESLIPAFLETLLYKKQITLALIWSDERDKYNKTMRTYSEEFGFLSKLFPISAAKIFTKELGEFSNDKETPFYIDTTDLT